MRRVSDAFNDEAYDSSLFPTESEESKGMKKKKGRNILDIFMDELREQGEVEKAATAEAKEARKNGKKEKSPERILGEELGKIQFEERTKNHSDNIDEVLEALEKRDYNETINKVIDKG